MEGAGMYQIFELGTISWESKVPPPKATPPNK